MKRSFLLPVLLFLLVVGAQATPATSLPSGPDRTPKATWGSRIDAVVRGHAVSVVVGRGGDFLYRHKPVTERTPGSNEKLLLSMAILDSLGPDFRIETRVATSAWDGSVVRGELWILGGGDPGLNRSRLSGLAKAIGDAGVTKVTGGVRGSTGFFSHDWWAPGWKRDFPATEVALPTALAYNGNTVEGRHIRDPERRAATTLTQLLRNRGIKVKGKPGAAEAPDGLVDIASIESGPLWKILRTQNVDSINFYAEEMGKLLGATDRGVPGTIAKGAKAIDEWSAENGVPEIEPHDSSGLSYDDSVTAEAVVKLLWIADTSPWIDSLRSALPHGGQGTLSGRLKNVEVRAKTGTLTDISALSGWVQAEDTGDWIEFSIISEGMPKSQASHIEDRIVAIVANNVA